MPHARRVAAQAADERPACTIFSYQTTSGYTVAPNRGPWTNASPQRAVYAGDDDDIPFEGYDSIDRAIYAARQAEAYRLILETPEAQMLEIQLEVLASLHPVGPLAGILRDPSKPGSYVEAAMTPVGGQLIKVGGVVVGVVVIKAGKPVVRVFERALLRVRMGKPPAHMTKPQAHHDLVWKHRDRFGKAGIDVNDPKYGRWVEGGPVGNHQKWTKQFEREWDDFFARSPDAVKSEILEKMNQLRIDPRFQ